MNKQYIIAIVKSCLIDLYIITFAIIEHYYIDRLQMIQNNAARVVTNTKRSDNITPVLWKAPHWLPIRHRIEYTILLLTYKCLNNLAPGYLRELIVPYKPTRNLRSSSQNMGTEHSPYVLQNYGTESQQLGYQKLE